MSDESGQPNVSAPDWLMAHRGWPTQYPENSLTGLEAVLRAGARHVEFDMMLSRDRVPMACHDESLTRLTGRDLRVSESEAAALSGLPLSVPGRFGDRFRNERLATVAQMLALAADWPATTLFVEIKRASLQRFGRSAVLDALLPLLAGRPNPLVLISFDAPVLEMARARAGWPVGWAVKPWSDGTRGEAARLAPEYLFANVERVPAGESPFWPGPWQWVVYSVNEPDQARAWRRAGASLVETDDLPRLAEALGDGG